MALAAPNQPKILRVARAFIQRDDDNRLLFARRSIVDRRHPGLWECPGGKVDPGEEMRAALLRETREETGLVIECVHESAYVDGYPILDGKYKGQQYEAHFNVCRAVGGFLTLSHEHEDHLWVTHAESLDLDLTPEVRAAAIALTSFLQ